MMSGLRRRWQALRGRGDESGSSITGLVVALFIGIIAVTGMAIDLGLHIRSNTRAERVAVEAARAGLQYFQAGGAVDAQTAVTAAENYLEAADVGDNLTGTAVLDGTDHLTVTVVIETKTVFVSVIGKDTVTSTGRGEADLARVVEGA